VSINKGTQSIGTVNAPRPLPSTLQAFVDAKVITMAELCEKYNVAKAIELQAAARRAKTSGKMPKSEFDRLSKIHFANALKQAQVEAPGNEMAFITEYITALWEEEQLESAE
jgi:hypothetical protein